ncbi:Hypothetical protein CINCED_3A004716 [Cinara cedri]|uniref:Uncharacterized protein n=1 Tax=Cinara cedri TaxID=506608 RepID=A0A5E4M8B2_9HEMI|nr:Hypothetical protein CINCED_3A004716 [Cinara cedri]
MNLNALKLLFYTLVVHIINPDIPNRGTAILGWPSNRSKFNKTVYDFQTEYNLKKVTENITRDQGDDFGHVPDEFIAFQIDLFLILQQMAYVLNKRNGTGLTYNEYFVTVCSLLPRCLDYININVFQNSITVLLNKMHIVLCQTLPTHYLKTINSSRKDTEKEVIYKEIERNLIYLISMLEDKTKINNNLFELLNYQKDSKNFLFEVYGIIGKIDKISCMSKKLESLNYYYTVQKTLNEKKLQKDDNRNNKNIQFLENEKVFLDVNINYTNILEKKCGLSKYKIRTNDLSKFDAMHELFVFTLNNLQQFFTNSILSTQNENSRITENVLEETGIITKMILDLCQSISYILVFFKENKFKDDPKMFNVYFTFCFDFTEYANTRCISAFHSTLDAIHFKEERSNCLWESLINIWTYNIFVTTTEVPKIKIDKSYLTTLYDSIKLYDKEIGVWTTYRWLSGKYFLTENFENVNMNELKLKNINIKNVTISLSVAYHAILPWHLNTFPVGLLHNMILQHLDRTMNTYVYRYALIIDLYLKRTSSRVNSHILQSIRDSVRWYTEGTELFYKYLDLPLYTDKDPQNEPLPPVEMSTIILRIKHLDDNGKINVDDIIPKDAKDDFLKWSETELPNNDDENHQFNTAINTNCMDAMDYMSTFISIAVNSLDIKSEFYPPSITYTEYCPKNIFNVKPVEHTQKGI